jgi:hypothetical protein
MPIRINDEIFRFGTNGMISSLIDAGKRANIRRRHWRDMPHDVILPVQKDEEAAD